MGGGLGGGGLGAALINVDTYVVVKESRSIMDGSFRYRLPKLKSNMYADSLDVAKTASSGVSNTRLVLTNVMNDCDCNLLLPTIIKYSKFKLVAIVSFIKSIL